jgi:hypothetical protein
VDGEAVRGRESCLVLSHGRSNWPRTLEALVSLRSGDAPPKVAASAEKLFAEHALWALGVDGLGAGLAEAAGEARAPGPGPLLGRLPSTSGE